MHIIPQSKGAERKQRGQKKKSVRDFHVYGLVELDQPAKNRENIQRGQNQRSVVS